jgi:hypothetical protein
MSRDKFLEMADAYNTMKKQQFELLKEYTLEYSELQDKDGYPTTDCLTLISEWHHSDPIGWFEFIHQQWYAADWGWNSRPKRHFFKQDELVTEHNLSTAGWSGNEAIIRAMEKNEMLWWMTWYESRRGGHYIFEVEKASDDVSC